MSVQVVSAAATAKVPEVELRDLSPSEAEPQLGLSTAAVDAMVPPAGGGDPEAPAPAPAAERPPAPGPGSGPTAALSPAAGKVPQASAMKRSDPHHQHQRHRDGGEALVSPDGTVTEAPRTVKKVLCSGCLSERRGGRAGERRPLAARQLPLPRPRDRGTQSLSPHLEPALGAATTRGSEAKRSLQVLRWYLAMINMEVAATLRHFLVEAGEG
ncbi:adenosylhomocysteinase 3 isoform X1 [Sigmodon hispidus]